MIVDFSFALQQFGWPYAKVDSTGCIGRVELTTTQETGEDGTLSTISHLRCHWNPA